MQSSSAGRRLLGPLLVGLLGLSSAVGACGGRPGGSRGASPGSTGANGARQAPAKIVEVPPEVLEAKRKAFEALDVKTVCRMPLAAPAAPAKAGIAPFQREDGNCGDGMCDVAELAPKGADACFVANDMLARADKALRSSKPGPAVQSKAWDHRTPPRWKDRVESHLHLDAKESAKLAENGFVVLDRRGYASYAVAFHDVFQQQLPVYIGIDPILEAVYRANETLLGDVERERLSPKLKSMLTRLRATLAASAGRYDAETIADLRVYLEVPQRLLTEDSWIHSDAPRPVTQADHLVRAAKEASAGLVEVDLFGRKRVIDFSQFQPRGHYTAPPPPDPNFDKVVKPESYFRAVMWLSRLELNLVSRSCRSSHPGDMVDASETPREAKDAIALADLVTRAGVAADLRTFEEIYTVFAGKREDVAIPDLVQLASSARIGPRDPDAQKKLAAAIGDRWKRTARTHFQPSGTAELPAITTLLGPRIVPDVAPLTGLVEDAVPGRLRLGAADVAYVLGHDRAKAHLASDLANHPKLAAALDRGRADLARETQGKRDVYSTWLDATRHVADKPEGTIPSFMATPAYADMKMSSALAAYAQIRHTFVLLAAQGYDSYGCEIPDGYVEPMVGVYDGLLAWARAASAVLPQQKAYFRRVEQVLTNLRGIAAAELAGRALTEPQRRFLAMVSEFTPDDGYGAGDSGQPPLYTGWYFDLFPDREIGATKGVGLVADYFTLTNVNEVRYLGVEKAVLGAFVVDVGGEPRMMVGPVVKPFETASELSKRLDDKAGRKAPKQAPWLASYVMPDKTELSLMTKTVSCDDGARVVVQGLRAMGEVSVTLLDHHGDALGATVTHAVGTEPVAFGFALPTPMLTQKHAIEGVHLHVHDGAASGGSPGRWDTVVGGSAWVANGEGPSFVTPGSLGVWGMGMAAAPDPDGPLVPTPTPTSGTATATPPAPAPAGPKLPSLPYYNAHFGALKPDRLANHQDDDE